MKELQASSSEDLVIVVNSCDFYADVWPLFFAAFKEYWQDCPFRLVINTESIDYSDQELQVTAHLLKDEKHPLAWGGRLIETLKDLSSEYVLMIYDDFILEDKVNTRIIEDCLSWMDSDKSISVFYLSNVPGSSRPISAYNGFEKIPRFTSYRLNSAPAVWRRRHLIDLTKVNDDPWIWELFGTSRTFFSSGKFYCARPKEENIYRYNYYMGGAIYRGKWVEPLVKPLIKRYGLPIDMKVRGVAEAHNTPRTFHEKLKMIIQGFRASGLLAPVIICLLVLSKFKSSDKKVK